MPTIREVAESAGVSVATASRVLGSPAGRFPVSRKTGERVRAAAEQLGYRINYHMQAVASGRANATGFCAEVTLDAAIGSGSGNLYFDSLRRGVEYTTQEAGGAVMSIHPGKGLSALQRGIDFMRERRLDALVVPASRYVEQLPHAFEGDASLPLVIVNAVAPIRRPRVVFDVQAAMRLVVDHLGGLGHRRILWLGPEGEHATIGVRRDEILTSKAFEAGISGEVCRVSVDDLGMTAETDRLIERVAEQFLQCLTQTKRTWTAVMAYNDQYAIAACDALARAGMRVPEDVSVMGFDNLIASFCLPGLTTIDHSFFEMGQLAGRMAAELVNADTDGRLAMLDRVETVAPKLVVRQSTGPAKPAE